MNEFSLEVALIWARANAEASAGQSAEDFSAQVVGVALNVQRLLTAGELAAASSRELDLLSEVVALRAEIRAICKHSADISQMLSRAAHDTDSIKGMS